MFPVFAMEINIHMHTFTQAAEHFTQQGLLALRISIIGGIKLRQQSPCTQNCLYYLRVFASNERFTR